MIEQENMTNSNPYIISICSGKGGVGKSVIAANLAGVLSRSANVLIWDADMFFPNQHFLLGVEPPIRLNDVYRGMATLDKAIFKVSRNLSILADMPALGKSEQFNIAELQNIYQELIQMRDFDFIIIDTPAGGTYEVIQCAAFSDLILNVITDEPTSLLDAYGLIKILLPYVDREKIKLLVNNVIDLEDADDMSRKLNLVTGNFLDFEIEYYGFIPYSRTVRQSIMQQELFISVEPEGELTGSIIQLGNTILQKTGVLA